jgi:transcriptional regulator with GAF, ATPase, and Fis domain
MIAARVDMMSAGRTTSRQALVGGPAVTDLTSDEVGSGSVSWEWPVTDLVSTQATAPGDEAGSREEILSDLFVALADTLGADYDAAEVFDRLVNACVEIFDVDSAAVLLLDSKGRLRLVASSDERAEQLELFQVQVEEGPCLDSARDRALVTSSDLKAEQHRWPRFAAAADVVGLRAVHAVPLRLRTDGIGTLGLFYRTPQDLSKPNAHIAQALADVATIGFLQQQQQVHQTSVVNEQLQGALDSRVSIEQAKGILAEFGDIAMDVAFRLLRRYCRDNNLKLSQVARAIAERELPPAAIVTATRHRPT